MTSYLLGIDAGNTNVKAVLFDLEGEEKEVAAEKLPTVHPQPGFIERDMEEIWKHAINVTRKVTESPNVDPKDIEGIGLTGHGDGLYFLDKNGNPVRRGIQSIDSRGKEIIQNWEKEGALKEGFKIIGFNPFPGNPLTLLKWLKENERESYDNIDKIVFCKDFLKYKLTGTICTDETESSAGFTALSTGDYSDDIFEIFGLEECTEKLPEIIPSWKKCGEITKDVARKTGLEEGTPVASGLHDIDAGAIGSGCLEEGQAMAIVGTWSINEVVMDEPKLDPEEKVVTRNYATPDHWLLMSSMPAATANLDWFMDSCCKDLDIKNEKEGLDPYSYVNEKVEEVPAGAGGLLFHPYLNGSLTNPDAGAGFYRITSDTSRAELLRAVYEGVAFATRECMEEMGRVIDITDIRISGGGSKSKVWTQIFADILGQKVKIAKGSEATAKGAAISAGLATDVYEDHESAVKRTVSIAREHEPDPDKNRKYDSLYEIYKKAAEKITPIWSELKELSEQ